MGVDQLRSARATRSVRMFPELLGMVEVLFDMPPELFDIVLGALGVPAVLGMVPDVPGVLPAVPGVVPVMPGVVPELLGIDVLPVPAAGAACGVSMEVPSGLRFFVSVCA